MDKPTEGPLDVARVRYGAAWKQWCPTCRVPSFWPCIHRGKDGWFTTYATKPHAARIRAAAQKAREEGK